MRVFLIPWTGTIYVTMYYTNNDDVRVSYPCPLFIFITE